LNILSASESMGIVAALQTFLTIELKLNFFL
jgi:hypothetical protein